MDRGNQPRAPMSVCTLPALIQSSLQVGDGSGLVIALGGELLQQAETLLHMGLHPSDIVDGFVQAAAKADAILDGVHHPHAADICAAHAPVVVCRSELQNSLFAHRARHHRRGEDLLRIEKVRPETPRLCCSTVLAPDSLPILMGGRLARQLRDGGLLRTPGREGLPAGHAHRRTDVQC